MASTAWDTLEQVLEEGGFVPEGIWSSGLINAEKAKATATTDLRYRHLFDTVGEDGPVIDLVYEVPSQTGNTPGTPSIYFKVLEEPSPEAIKKLRTQVWNQGRAPTLWIVTPGTVLIYDSYARPQGNDDKNSHLLAELQRIGGHIKFLHEFHKQFFDTGNFWLSEYGKKIEQKQRVDVAMLADLAATEHALVQEFTLSKPALPISTYVSIAHALLGRAIFVSYLEDRGLLDPLFFQREYNCNSFKDILNKKETTYAFFGWLRETFNGDLFPLQENEQVVVEPTHLWIVQEFLSGTDMSSYSSPDSVLQRRLWPYRFDFIPVELISSIYEMFAHSRNSIAAEASSVHYTRLPLVELVLSLAMQDVHHTAKVLDPACGSGIFLVEAFRRLAWMRAKEYGRVLQRDELHEMLCSQIFGIDIDRDAVHVAAFSLYLTLLELDPNPRPLAALKFPPLLPASSQSNKVPNLYIQDFCNTEHFFNRNKPFINKDFDLIVGNPPWTALTKEKAPRDPDNSESGHQWGLKYCIEKDIPDKKPDQAFMIRVRDFAQPGTHIAFIIGSRVFYQQKNTSWLHTFLSGHTVETVVNLSDLVGENILFGGNSSTLLPASVILFRVIDPRADNRVTYITPKWYPGVSKREEIIITPEDVHYISQRLLREKPFLWKSAFRGTDRDYRLLSELQKLPSLGKILAYTGVSELAHRGISFGRIEQKPTPPTLRGKPFLASNSIECYRINITTLELLDRTTIAARSNTKFLQLPALIIPRSLVDGHLCSAIVEASNDRHQLVIDHMYYGIPSSVSFPSLIYRLNAILNSKMAFYMAFMLSSALGWDRRLIEVGDWQQIYLPDSILNNRMNEIWEKTLQMEQWLRSHWQCNPEPSLAYEIAQKQDMLDQLVFQLYDLSEQEIILVEDTLRYTIYPFLHRKKKLNTLEAFAEPNLNDLQTYARRLCLQLNGILHAGGLELTATVLTFEHSSPLCVCRFTQKVRGDNEMVTIVHMNGIEEVLNQMASHLRAKVADHLYVQRSLRVYQGESFWIIKGREKRLWSESAALRDADAVVRDHMEA